MKQRVNDSFGWSGTVTLPTYAWTVELDFLDDRGKAIPNAGGISATISPVDGTTAGGKTQYLLHLTADREDTANWPAKDRVNPLTLILRLRFVGAVAVTAKNDIEVRTTL
ncbi:hypothetical protein [Methylosinus sp. PW1]|uniref:hypothetical protein n=1 Tax=Methylosinus sp. PW1 TaxID=107636 RepID=UPI00056814F1|nr:hypothetical protein [Methylosinus sp. PW1]